MSSTCTCTVHDVDVTFVGERTSVFPWWENFYINLYTGFYDFVINQKLGL